jgi:hypothetical protein
MSTNMGKQQNRLLRILLAMITIPLFVSFACSSNENPPWVNIPVYFDTSKPISIKNGEQFIVKYSISDAYPMIKTVFDDNQIKLTDEYTLLDDNKDPRIRYFLFKAVGVGETTLSVLSLSHLTENIEEEKNYKIMIE